MPLVHVGCVVYLKELVTKFLTEDVASLKLDTDSDGDILAVSIILYISSKLLILVYLISLTYSCIYYLTYLYLYLLSRPIFVLSMSSK